MNIKLHTLEKQFSQSKADLGALSIKYIDNTGKEITEKLDPNAYEITGYTNNTNAI